MLSSEFLGHLFSSYHIPILNMFLTFSVFVVLQPSPIAEHFNDASIVHELRNEDKEDFLSHTHSWLFTAEVKPHSFHTCACFQVTGHIF